MARYRIISKRRLLTGVILFLISGALFVPLLDQYIGNYLVYLDELAKIDPRSALEKNLAMLQLLFTAMAIVLCFFWGIFCLLRKEIYSYGQLSTTGQLDYRRTENPFRATGKTCGPFAVADRLSVNGCSNNNIDLPGDGTGRNTGRILTVKLFHGVDNFPFLPGNGHYGQTVTFLQ